MGLVFDFVYAPFLVRHGLAERTTAVVIKATGRAGQLGCQPGGIYTIRSVPLSVACRGILACAAAVWCCPHENFLGFGHHVPAA